MINTPQHNGAPLIDDDDTEKTLCDGIPAPGRTYIDQIGFFGDAVAINGEWAACLFCARTSIWFQIKEIYPAGAHVSRAVRFHVESAFHCEEMRPNGYERRSLCCV